jgi:hypothetical protein
VVHDLGQGIEQIMRVLWQVEIHDENEAYPLIREKNAT